MYDFNFVGIVVRLTLTVLMSVSISLYGASSSNNEHKKKQLMSVALTVLNKSDNCKSDNSNKAYSVIPSSKNDDHVYVNLLEGLYEYYPEESWLPIADNLKERNFKCLLFIILKNKKYSSNSTAVKLVAMSLVKALQKRLGWHGFLCSPTDYFSELDSRTVGSSVAQACISANSDMLEACKKNTDLLNDKIEQLAVGICLGGSLFYAKVKTEQFSTNFVPVPNRIQSIKADADNSWQSSGVLLTLDKLQHLSIDIENVDKKYLKDNNVNSSVIALDLDAAQRKYPVLPEKKQEITKKEQGGCSIF